MINCGDRYLADLSDKTIISSTTWLWIHGKYVKDFQTRSEEDSS